ncbi:hypothetical protein AB6848_21745 [Serratia proteamaculans]|uniref:hypothetical protein n=1 Tax=Serratia proteamaculans TaxID=28151 RepID=UPI0021C98311|nr:hypothetical protein [Serratia proteamaculans]
MFLTLPSPYPPDIPLLYSSAKSFPDGQTTIIILAWRKYPAVEPGLCLSVAVMEMMVLHMPFLSGQ